MKMPDSSSHVIKGRVKDRVKDKVEGKGYESGHSQGIKGKLIRNDEGGVQASPPRRGDVLLERKE